MKLYGYWRSSASWRVRIGLNLKGVEVEHVPVHLVRNGGEQKAAEHLERNPMGQVPVLELDDGRHITQSLAILSYLDETIPEPPLLPTDPFARAQVRGMTQIVNSGIQPLQNLYTLRLIDAFGKDSSMWATHHIGRGLAALERLAAPLAGTYLMGNQITVADLCLIPQLYNARRFNIPLQKLPTLIRVEEACSEHPAFQAAIPERQPDAPDAPSAG